MPALAPAPAAHSQSVGPAVALLAPELRLALVVVVDLVDTARSQLDAVRLPVDSVQLARAPAHLVPVPLVLLAARLVALLVHLPRSCVGQSPRRFVLVVL